MSGAIPLLSLYALVAWTGKTLPLPFTVRDAAFAVHKGRSVSMTRSVARRRRGLTEASGEELLSNVRQCTSIYVNIRQCTSMYVNIRQCTSMYVLDSQLMLLVKKEFAM